MRKIVFFSLFVSFYFLGCAVKTNSFVNVEGNEKVLLNVISSLNSKEFTLITDNKSEAYIKSANIQELNGFHLMKYDANRKAFIYDLKIGDYRFYNKIKSDTIFIRQGKEVTRFIFIK